jgi:hypothetical protein
MHVGTIFSEHRAGYTNGMHAKMTFVLGSTTSQQIIVEVDDNGRVRRNGIFKLAYWESYYDPNTRGEEYRMDLNHRFTVAGADLKAFVPVRKAISAARELQVESRCIDAFLDDATLTRDKRITRYATCSGCWNTFDSVKKDIQLHMP